MNLRTIFSVEGILLFIMYLNEKNLTITNKNKDSVGVKFRLHTKIQALITLVFSVTREKKNQLQQLRISSTHWSILTSCTRHLKDGHCMV